MFNNWSNAKDNRQEREETTTHGDALKFIYTRILSVVSCCNVLFLQTDLKQKVFVITIARKHFCSASISDNSNINIINECVVASKHN